MTLLWWLRRPLKNGGMVDFGWPSGLVLLGVYFFLTGDGWMPRRAVIGGMFVFCGLRFMAGWIVRFARDGEDRRWGYWRRHWQDGNGPLGIRSEDFNFLIFYHMQSLTTLLIGAAPLALCSRNGDVGFGAIEIAGIALWVTSYTLENVADYQLDRFLQLGTNGVCRVGLWGFSRHPNYFFEFLLWVAYCLYGWESAAGWIDQAFLLLMPVCMYWFLLYYTGIPLTERASLERRGRPYEQYQREVSRFIPWFPRRT